MKRFSRPYAFLCAAMLLIVGAAVGCNKESDVTLPGYTATESVAVRSFKLTADARVMKDLDSVYFSIDLDRGVIYNADSLPKGTKITALKPVISFANTPAEAEIIMTGGSVRTGTVDYKKNSTDTIDFSGDVTLRVKASDNLERTYTLKVNVHRQVPDSIMWTSLASAPLPSRMANPKEQRTVAVADDGALTMVKEADGSYTVAQCSSLANPVWEKKSVSLSFAPNIRSLHYFGGKLVMLDQSGSLCVSEDMGATWAMANCSYESIVGVFTDQLIAISNDGGSRHFTNLDSDFKVLSTADVPMDFPLSDRSNMSAFSTMWAAQPIAILSGGVKADGSLSNAVWGYDGNVWTIISNTPPPALQGASLIPYYMYRKTSTAWVQTEYTAWLLVGGKSADGSLNREVYVSYDNGVSFIKGRSYIQFPAGISPVWGADALVASRPMSANLNSAWSERAPKRRVPMRIQYDVDGSEINWQCPYIYIVGGHEASGALRTDMLRGVLARLTFAPLF